MKKPLVCLLFISLTGLLQAADLDSLKAELAQAEKSFCQKAESDGLPAAFLANIAPDGVLLVAGYEKRGDAAVREIYGETKPNIKLQWKPEIVDVATSGDLGYTTGAYELHLPNPQGGDPIVRTGRYVTVWKRQSDGQWKFVLDAGTQDQPKKK